MSLVISPILSDRSSTDNNMRNKPKRNTEPVLVLERSKWSYYHKPLTLIVFGAIVFLTGVLYTMFYFTKYLDVPYALGPVFLSIGLMFLVTGLVWLPVVREAIRQKGLLRKINTQRATEAKTKKLSIRPIDDTIDGNSNSQRPPANQVTDPTGSR